MKKSLGIAQKAAIERPEKPRALEFCERAISLRMGYTRIDFGNSYLKDMNFSKTGSIEGNYTFNIFMRATIGYCCCNITKDRI